MVDSKLTDGGGAVTKQQTGTTTNNEQLLQLAIRAAREGNTDGARVMLRQIYDRDNRNEQAIYWLARLSSDPRERQQWLKKVLKINPNHEGAKAAMKKLQYKSAANENRLLLIGGAVVVMLIVLAVAIFLLVSALN
jgi:thioredoxin-like negative regulator of GroEL